MSNDCTGPLCRVLAQWIRSNLDYDVDPCTDFYRHVCGRYRGGDVFDDMVYSKEQDDWLLGMSQKSPSSNVRDYALCFLKMGARPKQNEELASKILVYEKEREWATWISKYTNGTYKGSNYIEHAIRVTSILKKLFESEVVGKVGLQYLVAWSIFRQLVNFTDPYTLRGDKTAEDACYGHVRSAMNLAIISHYFQREYLPDVPEGKLFPTWIKARSLSAQYTWKDATALLYKEDRVNAYLWPDKNAIIVQTAIMLRPLMYLYGPIGLNYGGLGMLSLRRQQERLSDWKDSENLADLVGTMISYAAFASLPRKYRDVKLVGLNMTSEQLFFMNQCVKWCAHRSTLTEPYAPYRSRCIVPLMNMPEFSRAFGCAAGTPMNPREKCAIW
ncbi:hypothetical protein HPB50_019129 [Hyalomma asiaticum]|uniref:Uncharacterized protein n=1 Tax=Hyalomma asiaticum TaxID=266040 RepID=A0ACB7SLD7_HYAAI|nr:hypothetical protein HPB50_019129 [Hyalomma asiaticum]